jgi:hypothetical protein
VASKVDICNLALSHISQGASITAIEPPDGSIYAEHCAQFYPIARDMCLEAHEWTFATTRVALASVDNPMPNQWAYAYALPADVIRPLAVLLPEATDDSKGQRYRIEVDDLTDASVLYTNIQDATLKYIRRQDDPTRYNPLMVNALSWLLAHFIAGPITKKSTVVDSCEKQWEKWMKRATGANAQSVNDDAYEKFVPEHIRMRDGLDNLAQNVSDWQPFPAPGQGG